jgi:3-deoxy-D-manno-octulosonic-acid transferase
MGSSFGLTAYRALSRRLSARDFIATAERPDGSLVWLHAAEPESLLAIEDLAKRLCTLRSDLSVLITVPNQDIFERARSNLDPQKRVHLAMAPNEHPDAVKAFWRHWRPEMGIWVWGHLRPNLLMQAHDAGCLMILIDAEAAGFDSRRDRWLPDLSRHLLEPFVALMVRSDAAKRRLEALGLPSGRVDLTPPLEAGGYALPCDDHDLADLANTLRGRPVWLASNVQAEELTAVLAAHRQAMRLSHRLLLVLHPAQEGFISDVKARVSEEGFRLADWAEGEDPDDATQVLLSRHEHDIGLFYRVAPVAFMASSLVTGYKGRSPFEAAALGCAVLHGPNVAPFMPFYTRLAKAGAARVVNNTDTLGAAVARLMAPDQAAAMAHAGWDVVSQGADLADRVIELVQAGLDGELERPDARP